MYSRQDIRNQSWTDTNQQIQKKPYQSQSPAKQVGTFTLQSIDKSARQQIRVNRYLRDEQDRRAGPVTSPDRTNNLRQEEEEEEKNKW